MPTVSTDPTNETAQGEGTASLPTRSRQNGLKSIVLVALAVLNAALVISLLGRFVAPNAAEAGNTAQGRASEYLIIPSRPLGVNQDVLYILDTDSGSLAVAGYDPTNNRIDFINPLRLRDVPVPQR